ncbi:MAG: D-tyrosyl-tRNA(Tyr) deacylase [Candidatus Handelsmanbacteria bacterium RIFCSPLOWO2_12_FULL_64_10]|uniref:D-aminoacyl-tRNA deacylase n=1 Tax=Handelsmanbacteria sp. (strain RIFCSPLOWO2_12_FULL_64_10) TaxID=1817868 RepID=A0A1F6CWK7_HANXR|nr:MAG: D-tyrosyl-tRNA(Tyr) deacylase [Candidatus Handelsmanbacteria bacterium RIFCSPLOWO2_12_FULL_64_10]
MRAVCQRVKWARVSVDGVPVGAIGLGWAVLLGVGRGDDEATAAALVDQLVHVRAFDDGSGRMALAAGDVAAEFLVVSQITLHADLSKGRRPSFTKAAPPERARVLVDNFAEMLRQQGFRVTTGQFGATMDVELCNEGPVTIVLATDGWG